MVSWLLKAESTNKSSTRTPCPRNLALRLHASVCRRMQTSGKTCPQARAGST